MSYQRDIQQLLALEVRYLHEEQVDSVNVSYSTPSPPPLDFASAP